MSELTLEQMEEIIGKRYEDLPFTMRMAMVIICLASEEDK